ncbi:MAG: hypothetical protein ACOX1Q_08570 [Eubacteriales bacterium]|jgi:putative aldouronate transport system substrate-binding protein
MKRILALLIIALLTVTLFSGCSDSTPQLSEQPDKDEVTPSPSADISDQPEEPSGVRLPITDEKTTITDWKTIQTLSAVFTDWNDCTGYQELEKRTNIHVEFLIPAVGNEAENFNLLMVSEEFPDIIEFFTSYYTRGIDDAIEQEIIIRLNDIVDMYMPNYKALISDPERALKTVTDNGNIGALYCIYDEPQNPWAGISIRKDWLDDLGLEIPRTYNEWYEVLTEFRDKKGATSPMLLNSNGDSIIGNNWVGGFGTINGFLQKNGTVYYGPLLPEYKTYLETFSKWYAEGLIDRDFTTQQDPFDNTKAYSGQAGAWYGFASGDYEYLAGKTEDVNFIGLAVQNPVLNKGDTSHFKVMSSDVGLGSCISTDCDNVEIVARWLDYCYSEEGSIYLNFGTENVTFFFDENGEPTMDAEGMEKVFNMPFATCRQATGPVEAPYLRRMYRTTPVKKASVPMSEYFYQSYETWGKDKQDWMIPANISPTAEEATEFATLFSDINTYVTENTIKIIVGSLQLSEYDKIVEEIKDMGIERCIELRQAAVTRYFERTK